MCYLPHTFGNAYALYAMKRDGLARVSKIDVDALLDKNKLLAVKVKSLGNHARRQPRATNSGTDRRACIE
jgi:hypothetical protein